MTTKEGTTEKYFVVDGQTYPLHPTAEGSHHVIATLFKGDKHWTFLFQNDPEMLEWDRDFAKHVDRNNKGARSEVVLVKERELGA